MEFDAGLCPFFCGVCLVHAAVRMKVDENAEVLLLRALCYVTSRAEVCRGGPACPCYVIGESCHICVSRLGLYTW